MDDAQFVPLVIRAKRGDNESFNELVGLFRTLVFKLVHQRVRDKDAIDDVMQDVFLRAFRKIGQLENPAKFKSWLCQIAVRLSINHVLRVKQPEGREYFNPAQEEVDPTDVLIANEHVAMARKGLKKLGQIYRDVIIAFYFDGLSIREMGERLNIPEGTAKRRLYEGRKMLIDVLQTRKELYVL